MPYYVFFCPFRFVFFFCTRIGHICTYVICMRCAISAVDAAPHGTDYVEAEESKSIHSTYMFARRRTNHSDTHRVEKNGKNHKLCVATRNVAEGGTI